MCDQTFLVSNADRAPAEMYPVPSASHQVTEVAWQSSVEKTGVRKLGLALSPKVPPSCGYCPGGHFTARMVYLMVLEAPTGQTFVVMGPCWF